MSINANTSLEELAVLVSEALSDAGIVATLSGGAAVSIYSENAYESADLDFVTYEGNKKLAEIIGKLGFSKYQGFLSTLKQNGYLSFHRDLSVLGIRL